MGEQEVEKSAITLRLQLPVDKVIDTEAYGQKELIIIFCAVC